MANSCFTIVDACAFRIARLTTAGAPVTGASQGYISDALTRVEIGLEIEEGAEFVQKNGCGQICAVVKETDKIKRATATLDLCKLDFELMSLLADFSLFSSGGNGIGMQAPAVDSGDPDPICFEVWSKAWDGASQAVPAFTTPDAAYLHFVLPFTRWTQRPFTLANGTNLVQLTGNGTENTEITANGPWNDWPTAVASAGGITRVYGVYLDDELPTASCGFQTVPSGS